MLYGTGFHPSSLSRAVMSIFHLSNITAVLFSMSVRICRCSPS